MLRQTDRSTVAVGAQESLKESWGRVPGGVIAEVENWCARGVWWDQANLRGLRASGEW